MPAENHDLHGSTPDHCRVGLLLIDVINDLEFANGARLFQHALPAAKKIAALKRRTKRAGIVPRDCSASENREANTYALDQMSRFLKADTRSSRQLDLGAIKRTPRGEKA